MNHYFYATIYATLSALTSIIYFTGLLIYPLTKKQYFILFLYVFTISFLLTVPVIPIGNSTAVILTVAGCLILILLYQKHIIINFICVAINYFFCVCLNNLVLSICYFFGMTLTYMTSHPLINCFFLLIQLILFYIIIHYIGNFIRSVYHKKVFPVLSDPLAKKFSILVCLELFACVMILIFNIIYGRYADYPSSVITFNSILFIIVFIFTGIILKILFNVFQKEQQLSLKLKEAENYKEYTSKLEELYLEIRTFKHDYMNILSSFYGFISEKNYDGLNGYFRKIILPSGQKLIDEDISFGNLGNLEVPEIKGVVYNKLFAAYRSNLTIILDIPDKINYFPMDSLDLVRILGIILDNSIEASLETDEKYLYIGFLNASKEMYIRIQNSSKVITNIEQLYLLNVSTKNTHPGIGLFEVQHILEHYPDVFLFTKHWSGMFMQELQICK